MRRPGIGVATFLLLVTASAAVAVAASTYVIHQVTDDTLTHSSVAVSGRHLYWAEYAEIEHDDGHTSSTPAVGRYLDRTTGRRARVDPTATAISSFSAAGDWVAYVRSDEPTPTLWAWNAVTGARRALDTPDGPSWFLDTDGTYCTFSSSDGAIVLSPLDGSKCFEAGRSLSSVNPAIDRGVVCWTSHDTSTGASTIFARDIRSGLTTSTRLARFSALNVDISGDRVVILGESPDYRSHLYVWNTRTGHVALRRSSHPAYMSSVKISGTRIVFDELLVGSYSRTARVLDLSTGAVADVVPRKLWTSANSFDGSIVGIQTVPRGSRAIQVAWCDLDEHPATRDGGSDTDERIDRDAPGDVVQPASTSVHSPSSRPSVLLAQTQEAVGSTTTDTASAEEPADPSAPPADGEGANDDKSSPGDVVPIGASEPEGSGLSPLALAAGALAVLAAVGAAGWLRARRART